MLDLICMYAIMACLFTFGKQAVINSAPFFLTGVRLMPSGILFLAYSYLANKSQFTIKKAYIPALAMISFFYFSADAFRLLSLKWIPSSHAALLSTLAPFMAAIIAYFWHAEKFTFKKIGALFLGFFGVLPLIIDGMLRTELNQSPWLLVAGFFCMLICVSSAVVGTFLFKQLLQTTPYSILFILGVAVFFGGALSLGLSLLIEPWHPIPVENAATVLPIVLFLFISHNLITQPLYGFVVKKYPVTLVTFGTLVTPVTSALLGYFLYKQPIGYTFIISLISLCLAFFLFYHEEKKEGLVR